MLVKLVCTFHCFHARRLRLLNQPAKRESLGIDTDLETLLAFFSASAAALLSAKITAGVVFSVVSVSGRINKSVDEALLFGSTLPIFLLTGGGPCVGGGGGAVGGLGGLEAGVGVGAGAGAGAGGMLPGSTVTLVAGLAYKLPLS